MVWRNDLDRVDLRVIEQFPIVGIRLCCFPLCCPPPHAFLVDITDRVKLCIWSVRIAQSVQPGDIANSDEANANFFISCTS